MKKKTSKRRWKKRALMGMAIPRFVIVDHGLEQWKKWEPFSNYAELYRVAGLNGQNTGQATADAPRTP